MDTYKSQERKLYRFKILISSIVCAIFFLFTYFTINVSDPYLSKSWFSTVEVAQANQIATTTTIPTPKALRIGIIAGHWQNDSGAVCPDGLTEGTINLRIATLVRQNLEENNNFDVDLLSEFDQRLFQYQAIALVSIHADGCDYINDEATGFKVSAAMSSSHPEKANRLATCLVNRYQSATGLSFHHNTITADMTSYHAFDEVDANTPVVIIETGYLYLDRELLTDHPDIVAEGITNGILCYVRNEPISGINTLEGSNN